jgi:hypothetical protein
MDFLLLLVVTLGIAIVVSAIVVRFFRGPMDKIFMRIIGEDVAEAWRKFLTFALFVVGISSGVQIWNLERFVMPVPEDQLRPVLTPEYWGLEIYRTIMGTLGGMAWALLVFFVVALVAFVIVKRGESRTRN